MALIILLNGRIILRCRERNNEGWLFLYMDLSRALSLVLKM